MANNDIRRGVRPSFSDVSDADIKLGEQLEKDGKTIPPDLKAAMDAKRAADGTKPPTPPEPPKPPEVTPPVEPPKTPPAPPKTEPPVVPKDQKKPGDGGVEPPEPRPTKYVPLEAHLEEKHKRQVAEDRAKELERQLSELPSKKDDNYEEEVTKLSEEIGLGVEEIKKLDTFFASRHKLPDAVVQELKESREEKAKREFWEKQDAKFDEQFDGYVKVEPEMLKHKDTIKELAFTEGYETISPWEIFTRFVKPNLEPPRTKGAEAPSGGSGSPSVESDYSKIVNNPEEIKKLRENPQEWAKFDKWLQENYGKAQIRRPRHI